MTNNEINIAIAEACGWKLQGVWWTHPSHPNETIVSCPSYTTDLNAMHEAEKTIKTDGSHANYMHYLEQLSPDPNSVLCADVFFPLVTATAAQRAEAFLRVKGKWKQT